MNIELKINKTHSQLILGITLRYARLKAGLALRDISELANVSHTLIANIETGKIVANSSTLKDLFGILHIDYRDDEKLIDEFTLIYNRVFHNLYMDRLDRTVEDIQYLEEHQAMFLNSIVIIDYSLLRFLHATLSNSMTQYLHENLDLLRRVGSLLSQEQQQLRHTIFGIEYYNRGLYKQAVDELNRARKMGNAKLDPLINSFIIRCLVKMFRFMDAQQLADSSLDLLEEDLNYIRAMDIRLAMAYSNMLVHKWKEAEAYLEKVCHFGTEFREQRLIDRSLAIKGLLYKNQGKYDALEDVVNQINNDYGLSILVKMFMADYKNDKAEVERLYHKAKQDILKPYQKRDHMVFDMHAYTMGIIDFTEEEYIQRLNQMIAVGMNSLDQELLMFAYDILIAYYQEKRRYKKDLELSEQARQIRSHGYFTN